jgi:ATP-dependent DNA helicase PIF1
MTRPDTAAYAPVEAGERPSPAESSGTDLPIGRALYEDVSGTAGTGKTTLARRLVDADPAHVVLAATTGIAAVNLGEGTTINALLRYFDTASLRDAYTTGHLQAQIRRLRRAGVTRILLDEKSMLSGQQLTVIARAIREVNEGGIYSLEEVGAGADDDEGAPDRRADLPPLGLTLIGDFGQLPPVPDKDAEGKTIPLEFAFDSPEWPIFAAHRVRLTKIWRQDAQDFIQALQAVREAAVQRALAFFTADRFSDQMNDAFEGTTIFAKNEAVERYNLLRLDQLKTPALTFDTVRAGKQRGDWKQIPDVLRLKEHALVMILANRRVYEDDDDDRGTLIYANGDLGIVEGTTGLGWAVTLQRTGETVTVYPVTREHVVPLESGERKAIKEAFLRGQGPAPETLITEQGKGRYKIVGTITYMPLRAAYGCTVHKTQGLTLDRVQINIRDPFFRQPGMLFVALSRARSAEGLQIVGNQTGFVERCRLEPRVVPWL